MVTFNEVIKHIRNKDNLVVVEGPEGMGKSTLLKQMAKNLKDSDRLNVVEFNWPRKDQGRIRQDLFQLTKNIIFIDNVELCYSETVSMV